MTLTQLFQLQKDLYGKRIVVLRERQWEHFVTGAPLLSHLRDYQVKAFLIEDDYAVIYLDSRRGKADIGIRLHDYLCRDINYSLYSYKYTFISHKTGIVLTEKHVKPSTYIVSVRNKEIILEG